VSSIQFLIYVSHHRAYIICPGVTRACDRCVWLYCSKDDWTLGYRWLAVLF